MKAALSWIFRAPLSVLKLISLLRFVHFSMHHYPESALALCKVLVHLMPVTKIVQLFDILTKKLLEKLLNFEPVSR